MSEDRDAAVVLEPVGVTSTVMPEDETEETSAEGTEE